MASFTICPACLIRDLREIYQLERDIFPQDAYPYPDLALLLLLPYMVNLKAVDESGKLLGFIAFENAYFPWSTAWVVTLGVGRAYQNQGVGGALLAAIEPRRRANRIRLTVRRGNTPAIHLYKKHGYQHLKLQPRYYRDGEDGLVMEKRWP